ncbi:MAG: 2Fe-2S iron-sulfur cluster-binding protein [Burkholderiales bacterium]|nr:(2Fe-2S)-binding protein [Sulfuricellaceae bacterium]
MSAVTFLNPSLKDKVKVDITPGAQSTLLSLALASNIPLRCQCKSGNCGVCAVKIVPKRGQALAHQIRLAKFERAVLYLAGKFTQKQYESDVLSDWPPLWRLACQYRVADEDILVAF